MSTKSKGSAGLDRRRNRRRGLALLVVVALVGASCQPMFGNSQGTIHYGVLTSRSGLQYQFSSDGSGLTAAAPAPFPDDNVREVYWTNQKSWDVDEESCATWDTYGAAYDKPIQPGIALRIAPTGSDGKGIKAITVTENVWFAGVWIFNVHVWDSTKPGHEFTSVAQFDLSPIVGKFWFDDDGNFQSDLVDPPWHVCAVTIGDQFSFKVWTGNNPEPSWYDSDHVFTSTLPDGWVYPGAAGWYVGHLHEDYTATISDQRTNFACVDAELLATQYCQGIMADLGLPGAIPTSAPPTTTVPAPSTTAPDTTAPDATAPDTTVAEPTPSTTLTRPDDLLG